MNFDNLKKALGEAAKNAGIGEYEIYYAASSETSVGGLNKEINSFSSGSKGGICLRLIKDGKMGYASTELMEESEMSELVVRAIENAENTEKPSEDGFFEGSPSYEELRVEKYEPVSAAKLKSKHKTTVSDNNLLNFLFKFMCSSFQKCIHAIYIIGVKLC